jgi:predicted acyltransferase
MQKIDHRNLVLDVIRGMAVLGLLLVKFPGNPNYVYHFLHYSGGNMFTDVVNSFFFFAVGVSVFYSFSKYDFSWSKQIAVKISKRVIALFIIGLALNLLSIINTRTPHFVVMGDLQYIALAYGLTAVLVLWLKRLRFLITVALLLTIICYLAFSLLPLPLDALKILSYVIIVLTGYVTITLCHGRTNRLLLSLGLFIMGLSCFLVSSVWEYTIPLNSIFIVKLMGYAWVSYACLIFLIDVCKWTKWTYLFVVPGKNALFIYVITAVFSALFGKILMLDTSSGGSISMAKWFYKNVCVALFGNNAAGSLCYAIMVVLLTWLLAWMLYRWKIFIKV